MPKLPKIEKNIPLPPDHNGGMNELYTIMDQMEVGDSVLFTNGDDKRARNNGYRRKPKQFTYRKTPKGFRCWRIA